MDLSEILASGAVTITASAVTLFLSQRHSRAIARDEARRSDREAAREVLVNLLHDARSWCDLAELVLLPMTRMSNQDLAEFVDTEPGQRLATLTNRFARTLTDARLRAGDPALVDAIADLSALRSRWAEDALMPIETAKREGASPVEALQPGLRLIATFRTALTTLEDAAAPLLRTRLSG